MALDRMECSITDGPLSADDAAEIVSGIDTSPWYEDACECPLCGEPELNHVATVPSAYHANRVIREYECGHCGHEENNWRVK